jgi:ubiquinone/menaquinone biosynthesis C-methylase UbiE
VSEEVPTPEDVLMFYATRVEADRLARGAGALEFERTKELLLRFLRPGSTVADVGGATGRYAAWLADRGCAVELVDPVGEHVATARDRAGRPARFGVRHADARALPFADAMFDAVLLLGPLYHLGEREDRRAAMREASRICHAGGLVAAAAISRLTPLLHVVALGQVEGEAFANALAETRSGRQVGPERRTTPFPDAYFHRPAELREELKAAGLEVEGVYGIEGPGWLAPELDRRWEDERVRTRLISLAGEVERDPDLLPLSAHLLAIARKP